MYLILNTSLKIILPAVPIIVRRSPIVIAYRMMPRLLKKLLLVIVGIINPVT